MDAAEVDNKASIRAVGKRLRLPSEVTAAIEGGDGYRDVVLCAAISRDYAAAGASALRWA